MIKHRKELNEYMEERGELELPSDFALDIPDYGRVWLLKGGVGTHLVQKYNIGWSEKLNRVVLPVFEEGTLTAVQSRSVWDAQQPKYLNKKGSSKALFWAKKNLQLGRVSSALCITEDILSAIRVGRLNDCVSTLGTILSDITATKLLESYDEFFIWYDGDEAGLRGARKGKKALEMQGGKVHLIKTDNDPKEYNNEDIKKIILRGVSGEGL